MFQFDPPAAAVLRAQTMVTQRAVETAQAGGPADVRMAVPTGGGGRPVQYVATPSVGTQPSSPAYVGPQMVYGPPAPTAAQQRDASRAGALARRFGGRR